MKNLFSIILSVLVSLSALSQNLSGDWTGELKFAGNTLDMNYKIYESDGDLKSMLSIPAQNLIDFKTTSTSFIDSLLIIEMESLGAKFQGKLSTNDTIVGNFYQNGMTLKLNLVRGNTQLNRPQEPQPPFDYYVEDVVFLNKSGNINLSGTLTLPEKEGQFPVVILISGSGPQDRNSYIMGHKPFLLLADELTKNGIGVLRYDERGVGESEGEFSSATIADLTADVKSAFDYLKTRQDVDEDKIGLLGHSLGGVIAPKLAVAEDISFLILLAAPGVRGDEMMLKQRVDLLKLRGLNDTQIEQSNAVFKNIYEFLNSTDSEGDQLEEELKEFLLKNYADSMMEQQRSMLVEQITTNEILGLLRNRPSEYLKRVDCPVLAIGGEKDFQVSSKENLAAIEFELEKGGNKNIELKEFKGLNHLFQESETGDINEYAVIEQTMSPKVIDYIKAWLKNTLQD